MILYYIHVVQTITGRIFSLALMVDGGKHVGWGEGNVERCSSSYAPIYIEMKEIVLGVDSDSEMYRTVVLWLLVALSLKSTASQPHDTSPLVTTVHGVLRGSVIQSRLGRPIYSFRGVRFAQPPVGNLRFKVRSSMVST
jgi:hypothetical protein